MCFFCVEVEFETTNFRSSIVVNSETFLILYLGCGAVVALLLLIREVPCQNSALTVVTLNASFGGFSSASVQCRYNVSDYTRVSYTHSLTSSCFD